jgi:ribonuclease HI
MTKEKEVDVIYVDGSCIGNGKKNAKASIALWYENNMDKNYYTCIKHDKLTNNVAELFAIKEALLRNDDCIIYTDSLYSINCIKRKYVNKGIPNARLIQEICDIVRERQEMGLKTEIKYIVSKTGGNKEADKLCRLALEMCKYS